MKTYYEILGITPDAPREIVTAVYRTWMHALKMHPDLGGDEELAKKINAAYEILKDPEKRAVYDDELGESILIEKKRERRGAPRYCVDANVACLLADNKWHAANARDASALGLRIRSNFHVSVGTAMAIAFPGSPSNALEAHVRWLEAVGNGEYEFGVEFFKPVSDILKRLVGKGRVKR